MDKVDSMDVMDVTGDIVTENPTVFSVIQGENGNLYQCNSCEGKFDSQKKVRTHKKTEKNKASMDNNMEKKSILEDSRLNESLLQEWDEKEIISSSTQADDIDKFLGNYVFDSPAKESSKNDETLIVVEKEDAKETVDETEETGKGEENVKQELLIAMKKIDILKEENEKKNAEFAELKETEKDGDGNKR